MRQIRARPLSVSIKCLNDMARLRREAGSFAPKQQDDPGRGKLTGVTDWVQRRRTTQPDLTVDALTAELAADQGLAVVYRPGRIFSGQVACLNASAGVRIAGARRGLRFVQMLVQPPMTRGARFRHFATV